ncbi:MAG: site-specific integrase, partial [Lachnospiraceae bacterium]|nr:site-specific integrase [Lachnospiraceae bacterium]
MTKDIDKFIVYMHDVRKISKNTELSYGRDLRKMSAFLCEQG